MKCLRILIMIPLILSYSVSSYAMDHRALAEHWAPQIQQQISSPSFVKEDQFTTFNYDLDWRSDNNWANLNYYSASPLIYYSVHETTSHYFLGYYLYYPRTGKYPNIMTGCMLAVEKDTAPAGKLSSAAFYNDAEWKWRDISSAVKTLSLTVSSGVSGERRIAISPQYSSTRSVSYGFANTSINKNISTYQLLPITILQAGLQQAVQALPPQFVSHTSPLNPPWHWESKRQDLWAAPAESLYRHLENIGPVSLQYISRP